MPSLPRSYTLTAHAQNVRLCFVQAQKGEAYIGVVIGALSVTVLLLLATIVLILRKNRQKIFSKHSCKLSY